MLTYHAEVRINQRGITKEIIKLALDYGRIEKDRIILGKRDATKLLNKYKKSKEIKKLLKIIDKGGVGVVVSNNFIITAYNVYK